MIKPGYRRSKYEYKANHLENRLVFTKNLNRLNLCKPKADWPEISSDMKGQGVPRIRMKEMCFTAETFKRRSDN